ncbi:MAG: regulatory protein RecX [Lachnospiraceae bacterium]
MDGERIVTDIQEFSKQKYSIYLNEEFAFVLYKGELSGYGLKVGRALGEKEYRQICQELLPKRAEKRCLNLLKSRAYTEKGLRDKLKEGRYPSDIIDEAIAYVKSFHYIDDYDYACQYIRCHKEEKSKRRIEGKLREKGIAGEILEKAFWDSYESGEEEQLMRQQAQHYLEKKGYDRDTCGWKEKQKLYGFLLRKGISSTVIQQVLD